MMRFSSPLVLSFFLLACGSAPDPGNAFHEMESRLLNAQSVSFDFHVVSEGVIDGDLRGSASVTRDGVLEIVADGSFIGRELQARLTTDADSMRMVTNELSDTVARPTDTFEAVIVGLTRMGFLHNLAQLSTVTEPEMSGGGAAEWVTVDNFSSGPVGEYTGTLFDIFVDGERTSAGGIALENGLPVERRQTVDFPGGQMLVTERYSNFVVVDQTP